MKILATSDWHLDAMTAGVSRYDDLSLAALQTVKIAIELGVDHYVFLGDLANPGAGALQPITLSVLIANMLTQRGIPSTWVVGNHDRTNDGRGTTTLTPLTAVAGIRVVDQWCWFEMAPDVVAIVYPYGCAHAHDVDVPSGDRRVVVLSHMAVTGAKFADGSEDKTTQNVLPVDGLLRRYSDAVILQGHYHHTQDTALRINPEQTEPPIRIQRHVHIVGALGRLNFADENMRPSCTFLEIDDRRTALTRVPLESRSVVTIDAASNVWGMRYRAPLKLIPARSFVRLCPPIDIDPERIERVKEALTAMGCVMRVVSPVHHTQHKQEADDPQHKAADMREVLGATVDEWPCSDPIKAQVRELVLREWDGGAQ